MKRILPTLKRTLTAILISSAATAWAAEGGSISGTVRDLSGAVIPNAAVIVRNIDTSVERTSTTNGDGFYALTAIPVGHYEIEVRRTGFKPYRRTGVIVDVNTALQLDVLLDVGDQSEEVTVLDTAVHVEIQSAEMGEVIAGKTVTGVALNGRSYTDLLALQPGIVAMSTQEPDSIVMAGASVAIAPSGGLNPGNQSISGQREDANGFLVDGGDVKEEMNGGTSIVPNLDSIAEFRILTNNFDAEYGNYSGGIVNVVTKSGTNDFHGTAFEFLRNTVLDAKNFFSPERAFYRQNQFGGTVGGPLKSGRVFFFSDYQGTRTNQGIDTGLIAVPSPADRSGNLSDQAKSLTGTVAGPYLANLLSQKLGYSVSPNERYYTAGCTSNTQCVFPDAVVPDKAWAEPAKHLLQFIPTPTSGSTTFSTGAFGEKVRDDKASFRLDGNSTRWGQLSAYYFFDDYFVNDPYPTGQGGASVPGFNALNLGRAQLVNLGQTKTFGSSTVNELRVSYMRNSNNVGQPDGGVGPSLASQGFMTGAGSPGIVPLAPQIEGIENVRLNSFVIGTPITNLTQANNTYSATDYLSKVIGKHTVKTGGTVSFEQVNVNPDATFNGSFLFTGSETGSDFADFLIGVASNYNQADSQTYYGRHKYAAAFVQDSWRLKSNLTLNFGLRWDLMQYWSEKYNQVPTFILGEQSKVYPTAPVSLVYPTDRGVPNTLVPERSRFSPRIGLAYSPGLASGLLGKLAGGPGKTSLRASYGIFYSMIEGNTIAIDEPQPPYGLSYTSPGPPLFATPFINAADGTVHAQPFPLTFPPLDASVSHPNSSIDFSSFLPLAGMTAPPRGNTYPYNESYSFSVERQLGGDALLSFSYVGSQAHHLLVVYSANPGNPALCLALSQPNAVAAGSPTCGPFGEDTTYHTATGQTVQGTRGPLGPSFANDDYDATIGNSNYNSFQASVRRRAERCNFSVGYTFSKSIDQASSISDPINPINFRATRALSAFDLRHSLVATYEYLVPIERLFPKLSRTLTEGWTVSGITRLSTGFPVTLSSDGDRSLMGSVPNGVNNKSLDLPDFAGGPLRQNGNPPNGLPYFNTSLFSLNVLGTPGDASRRFFYGPGMFNTDLALRKVFHLSESKYLELRLESFNTFNHTQFFGPAAVNGDISSPQFGLVVRAMPPRLMQLALKCAL